jgi:hypothetical protein
MISRICECIGTEGSNVTFEVGFGLPMRAGGGLRTGVMAVPEHLVMTGHA